MQAKINPKFHGASIRALAALLAPAGVTNYMLKIRATKNIYISGRAYPSRNSITLTVPERKFGRYVTAGSPGKGYITGITLGSGPEALVFILAHELRHLWQYLHPRGWRVWGARGRYSERDADAYALQQLRRARRHETQALALAKEALTRNRGIV